MEGCGGGSIYDKLKWNTNICMLQRECEVSVNRTLAGGRKVGPTPADLLIKRTKQVDYVAWKEGCRIIY